MENYTMIMCQLDEEGSNGKQQFGDMSFPIKRQRKNTEEIGTTSSLHHLC